MKALQVVESTAVPLNRSDVDTDQIIPSDWLKRIERTGFGQGLFSEWREDPEFVLNQPQYKGAEILIAGSNFGIGSSREHAVWALLDYGFSAVISPRFGDIFRNNAAKNGLLTVTLSDDTVDALMASVETEPTTVIAIDVKERAVSCPAISLEATFPLDDFTQNRLLNGLDDIASTMQHQDDIAAYEAKRPAFKPTTN